MPWKKTDDPIELTRRRTLWRNTYRRNNGYKGGVYRAKGTRTAEHDLESSRQNHIKILGFTKEEHAKLSAEGCALCGKTDVILCSDHCHQTNKKRELLCRRCNFGLGQFDDNPERLHLAALYVEAWRVRHTEAK